jgi:hypothetical protein
VRLRDPRPEKKKKKQKKTKKNKPWVSDETQRDPARSGKAIASETPARFLLLSLFFFLLPSSFSFLSSLIGCMVQNGFVHFFFSLAEVSTSE